MIRSWTSPNGTRHMTFAEPARRQPKPETPPPMWRKGDHVMRKSRSDCGHGYVQHNGSAHIKVVWQGVGATLRGPGGHTSHVKARDLVLFDAAERATRIKARKIYDKAERRAFYRDNPAPDATAVPKSA